ncbi:hypothetical protein NQZ68_001273 [Dissostichus eleginoides]|nr:hypothetical protein NQZ68_001273 [Dissostichus eleginoides]
MSEGACDCNFEKPLAACGYSQGRDDDLDWEQANTREKPSSDPWLPSGSAFMMMNTSGRFAGQKALLLTPQLRENDTHCVTFHYYIGGRDNSHPGHLNVYIKENNSPMGMPVWNVSGSATRSWGQVELAVSTYWPNFYQIVFEAVTSGQRGLLAIKDVVVQGHQCMNTPHFLTIKGVEVNAGQTASFHCTVNGRKRDNFRLWLQGIGGREAPMKATKPWNNRRFIGTFDVENTTKGDSGRYRCIVHSDKGVGVSNYGELTIKRLILAVQIEVCQSCENGRAQTEQSEEGDKVSLPECISGFQWCTQRKFTDTLEALKTTLVHKFSNTITRTYTYSPDGNAGAAVEESAAVARPLACLVNIMTTAAR